MSSNISGADGPNTTKQLTFNASSKSTGSTTYRFFRTANGNLIRTSTKPTLELEYAPWRPAACTMEAISADDSRSGLETSAVLNEHDNANKHADYPQSSRSTSGPRFILLVTVWKMRRFSRRDGRGNSIFLSRRPGRSNAGSSVSARFVAMITCIRGRD